MKKKKFTKPEHEDEIYTEHINDIPELQESDEYFLMVKELSKPDFFKELARLFLSLADKGKITRQTAAYKIAELIIDEDLQAIPEIKGIMLLAGNLELPYIHATAQGNKASYDEMWQVLQNMINHLIVEVVLFCRHCENPFIFPIVEQALFATQGRIHAPYRCPPCCDLHKTQVDHTTISCEVC